MPLFFNYFFQGKLLATAATILFVLPLGATLADKPAHGFAKAGFPTKTGPQKERGGGSGAHGSPSHGRGSYSHGSHQNDSRQFPKTTGYSAGYQKGHGNGSHSYGYAGSKHRPHQNHNNNGYHHGNYGHYNDYRYNNYFGGGSPYFFTPFGLAFSYTNQEYGFGVSSARYYRPGYGYYGSRSYPYLDYPRSHCSYARYISSYYAPRSEAPFSAVDRLAAERLMSDDVIAPAVPISISPSSMIGTNAAAMNSQLDAETAFREGRYGEAVELVDQAIALDRENGHLYLFSSQVEFAIGNFPQAVADLRIATEQLTSEQWSIVVRNYRNFYGKNDYVLQMEQLSNEIAGRPADFGLKTLRGFQYGALGYPDAAARDFQQAMAISPDDVLTKRLMPVLGKIEAPMAPTPVVEGPVPPGTIPMPEELPPPRVLEEIQAPLSMLRLIPESNTIAPELTGPSK